jgi:hypothetical protein
MGDACQRLHHQAANQIRGRGNIANKQTLELLSTFRLKGKEGKKVGPLVSFLWSISPTFYARLFRTKVSCESFVRSFFVLEVKVKLFICARILAQLRQ